MHEEMHALLNAYLDGELQGRRLREMEIHLASCADCQKELKELRLVSDVLRAVPTPEVPSSERFVSQLTLRLPRRTQPALAQKPALLGLVACPGGIAGSLVLYSNGIYPDQRGDSGEFDRPAGERQPVVWQRSGVDLAQHGNDPVRWTATRTAIDLCNEQYQRLRCQPFERVPVASSDRPALLGLANLLVAAPQPATRKNAKGVVMAEYKAADPEKK